LSGKSAKICVRKSVNHQRSRKSAKRVLERFSRLLLLKERGHIIQCLQFPHRVQERRWRCVQAPFLPYGWVRPNQGGSRGEVDRRDARTGASLLPSFCRCWPTWRRSRTLLHSGGTDDLQLADDGSPVQPLLETSTFLCGKPALRK
jgi:hypothetical protein